MIFHDQTFVVLFGGLFECIAYDESLHSDQATNQTPSFGSMCHRWNARDAVYRDEHRDGPFIQDFYNFWTKFKSRKDFSWLDFVHAQSEYPVNRSMRR